jgi:hypothetical protein
MDTLWINGMNLRTALLVTGFVPNSNTDLFRHHFLLV